VTRRELDADCDIAPGKHEVSSGADYHLATYDECMGEMKEIATTCQKNG
jgi:hypothetical protein